MNAKSEQFFQRTYSFNDETLALMDEIGSFRQTRCPNYKRGWTKRSRILRDAIRMLWLFEVCEQSIIHPKDAARKDRVLHGNEEQKAEQKPKRKHNPRQKQSSTRPKEKRD